MLSYCEHTCKRNYLLEIVHDRVLASDTYQCDLRVNALFSSYHINLAQLMAPIC